MSGSVRPEEAAGALAEIQFRHVQAVLTAFMPVWYWWALGLLDIGLVAAVEARNPVVTGVGVAAAMAALAALHLYVLRGAVRAPLRREFFGPFEIAATLAFGTSVVAAALAVGFALDSSDVPFPATMAMVGGGVILVTGGPLLIRYLKRRVLANLPGSPR